jgi:hypothetical protein
MRSRRFRRGVQLAVFAWLGIAAPALAFDVGLYSGYSTVLGDWAFTYTGLGVERLVSSEWVVKGRIGWSLLTFPTEDDDGKAVHAEAMGIRSLVGAGYRFTPDLSVAVLAGGQMKETRFFGGTPSRRNDNGLVTELQFGYTIAGVSISGMYSYSWGDATHDSRLGVSRDVYRFGNEKRGVMAVGVEASGNVGRDFTEERISVFTEITHKPTDAGLTLGIGVARFSSSDSDSGSSSGLAPYFSVDVRIRF